jgi:predicted HicB family RNase H-like nuclease
MESSQHFSRGLPTLRTPHSLWTTARITALKEGISVQELVTKAIREYVKGGRS